jgi:hypothetical protein
MKTRISRGVTKSWMMTTKDEEEREKGGGPWGMEVVSRVSVRVLALVVFLLELPQLQRGAWEGGSSIRRCGPKTARKLGLCGVIGDPAIGDPVIGAPRRVDRRCYFCRGNATSGLIMPVGKAQGRRRKTTTTTPTMRGQETVTKATMSSWCQLEALSCLEFAHEKISTASLDRGLWTCAPTCRRSRISCAEIDRTVTSSALMAAPWLIVVVIVVIVVLHVAVDPLPRAMDSSGPVLMATKPLPWTLQMQPR